MTSKKKKKLNHIKTQRKVVSDFRGFAAVVPPPQKKKMPDGFKTP